MAKFFKIFDFFPQKIHTGIESYVQFNVLTFQ